MSVPRLSQSLDHTIRSSGQRNGLAQRTIRRTRADRSGVSMLEIIVVVSVTATLMTLCVSWIHQSMKFASKMRDRQHAHQSLLRLSRELRDDVNLGKTLSMKDGQSLQIANSDSETIVYTIEGSVVLKTVFREREATKSERFELIPGSVAIWRSDAMPDTVSLTVRQPSPLQTTHRSATDETPTDPASATSSASVDFYFQASCNRWPDAQVELSP
ncbi:MAG: hypothetical protein R3C05_11305 [Pirellulaceae bacterium]